MNQAPLHETIPTTASGLQATVKLNNGVEMPWLGLGVFQVTDEAEVETCVRKAIELGYRSIDTAAIYGNESGVGRAIKACSVPRDQLFITTKLWNDDMRRGRCEDAFVGSLERLGLDYVDLYLLHWPIKGKMVPSWRVLEKLHRGGLARAIGVSNYMIPHLDALLATAEIVPAVNQIEFHPYLQSKPLVAHCQAMGIVVESWSPLMQAGALLQDRVLAGIAGRHGKTVAQVVLRWDLQRGVVTIPKSVHPARIAENAAIFDFVLTPAELDAIDALDRNQRNGADPFNFNF